MTRLKVVKGLVVDDQMVVTVAKALYQYHRVGDCWWAAEPQAIRDYYTKMAQTVLTALTDHNRARR